nr:MAG TPA: hypothetical protein [Caudoviricetes sp.]
MVPIVPLQVCETCRGFFCSQGDNELAALDLGSEILLQECLDGVAGRQAPHTAIGLDERNAAVADADEERAFRLFDLLERAIRAELDNGPDLLIGLECDALLGGHGSGNTVVVVDDLGTERNVVDELHRIERVWGLLEAGTQRNLGLFKAERDFRIPAGNISCVRRVIDRAVAALLIVRLREADHIGGRRDIDEKCRGIDIRQMDSLGTDHLHDGVETMQGNGIRRDGSLDDLLRALLGDDICAIAEVLGLRAHILEHILNGFFEHGNVLPFLKLSGLNELEHGRSFLLAGVNRQLPRDLRNHLNDGFLIGDIESCSDGVGCSQSGFGHTTHSNVLARIVWLEVECNGDFARCGCRGVGIKNVLDNSGHLIVHAFLNGTACHVNN